MKPYLLLFGLGAFAVACASAGPHAPSCRGPACSPVESERGSGILSCEGWWCPDGTIETGVEATSSDTAEDHDAVVEEPVAEWSPEVGESDAAETDAGIDTALDHGVPPVSEPVEPSHTAESASSQSSASSDSTEEPEGKKDKRGWPRLIYEVPTRERD